MTFDSFYEIFTNPTSVRKNHFWEDFTGSNLHSRWNVQTDSSSTAILQDAEDDGVKFTTSSGNNDVVWISFANKRQYNPAGSAFHVIYKPNHTSLIGYNLGLFSNDGDPSVGANNNNAYFVTQNLSTAKSRFACGGGSITYTDGTTTVGTDWVYNSAEVSSSSATMSGVSGLEVTQTSNFPTSKLQPKISFRTADFASKSGHLRYFEVYNT
jgi:hypothetical protein